jgi:hypothetical protein
MRPRSLIIVLVIVSLAFPTVVFAQGTGPEKTTDCYSELIDSLLIEGCVDTFIHEVVTPQSGNLLVKQRFEWTNTYSTGEVVEGGGTLKIHRVITPGTEKYSIKVK